MKECRCSHINRELFNCTNEEQYLCLNRKLPGNEEYFVDVRREKPKKISTWLSTFSLAKRLSTAVGNQTFHEQIVPISDRLGPSSCKAGIARNKRLIEKK